MMVAIVALSDFAKLTDGKYSNTVNRWINRAKAEWVDDKTGLLVSFLDENGTVDSTIRGSYAALNCYYLTKIDTAFAKEQYNQLKTHFRQKFPAAGLMEYYDHSCRLGMDIDAGPVILNLSPSGTAFAIGSATFFDDNDFRNRLLKTAEIAGHTVKWGNKRHYLLADIALVGEAITLAMRTNRAKQGTLGQKPKVPACYVKKNQNLYLKPNWNRPWAPKPASANMAQSRLRSTCAPTGTIWKAQ